ncbi:MAG: YraN family protein [Desulfuromonas sp.]|nr:YraN family protein [Desulfuromonas sp.]
MTLQRLSVGKRGEELAVRYLKRRLYRIVATNYRWRGGEIDIIAQRGGILSFVEVKTRRGQPCGTAAEAVTARKQQQIIRTAQRYLAQTPVQLQPRFDVIAIQMEGDKPRIEHIVDAFAL